MISLASVRAEGLPPHAAWLGADEYLGGDLSGRYPLHLLTPQPVGRLHSQAGLSSASRTQRRDGYEVLRIHPEDARARRICDGDIVEIEPRRVCRRPFGLSYAAMSGASSMA
ncbi:molybdopterin dinucleotide binding domain-containing protein [Aerobium aerolatum]|uniref:molybdopterin dinucleotide binding domain-containing protein n=1 Tax=Aerobium aerolatum TaxID=561088 RepID=UPI001588072A